MFIEDTDDNTTEDISKETIEEISKEMEDCINQKMRAIADYQNLKRRVDEAAQFIPIENLCLSPQCGFASMAVGNLISEDDQWRKLELCAETAEEIWG